MLYPVELRALCNPSGKRRAGRGREIRTPDILLPKQARYQTALYPADASGKKRILLGGLSLFKQWVPTGWASKPEMRFRQPEDIRLQDMDR